MRQKKKPYLTSEELSVELAESQRLGQPTIKVCEYFKLIAKHLLGDSRYRRYPKDMQEDMESNALLKCIRNIKNYKPQYADKCFNYFTRCVEHSFWTTLSAYCKHINLQLNMTLRYADELEETAPQAADAIRSLQIHIEHNKDKITFKGNKQ